MRKLSAVVVLVLGFTFSSVAQGLYSDLARLVETPAVTGHEGALARRIESAIEKFKPKRDNLGNVYVTLGTGAPHRLIVAPTDEPGYVVSGITDDGYLRVQRLPQQAPHALFDQLHAAQAVVIETRKGKSVYGVVTGLSTHLQGGRRDAPRGSHPDEMYIDIGARSPAEVKMAGVDMLDPIALDRSMLRMSGGLVAGMGVGDRFGAAALVHLLDRIDAGKVKGTLTVAFVAQQWATSRGLDRLMQHVKPDEVVYVGRLLARRGGGGGQQTRQEQPRAPQKQPGSGVLIGLADPSAIPMGLAAEIWKLAESGQIPVAADFTAPLPRVSYTQGPVMPERFAHIAVATAWTSTPAEVLSVQDAEKLVNLLDQWTNASAGSGTMEAAEPGLPRTQKKPITAPPTTKILEDLVGAYGISGFEKGVREEIERLLPAWAKPETDSAGNLVLRMASANAKGPKLLFVAHMDEIGYVVRSIADDGRLVVQSRGGGIIEFFAGHPMLVRTTGGTVRPGVMELPSGWESPDFEWPRGAQAQLRVDVGARSPAEVEQLGIKVGDWMTVPKKYRKLYGTRANGRSFDDRVGCTALVAAVWALGPQFAGRDVTFAWVTEEEVGLRGAKVVADRLAAEGRTPDYVFAVDTFVSSDSPIESKRFANAEIGKGFVIRAVDNSNIVPLPAVDKVIRLARANNIPVQYGVTGGGNDGAVFLRHGAVDIPISWPLRYSHSPGEVIDTRDVDALARIVAVLARSF